MEDELQYNRRRKHVATVEELGAVTARGKVMTRMIPRLIRFTADEWALWDRQRENAGKRLGRVPSNSQHALYLMRFKEGSYRKERRDYLKEQEAP